MKKRTQIILYICAAVLLIITTLSLNWRRIINNDDKALVKQANEIINKLDNYKQKYHKAPDSLQQLGLKIPSDFPLDYVREDSVNYVIGFQFVAFHSKAYHSARKQWEIN